MSIHRPKRVSFRSGRDAGATDSKEAKAPEWAQAIEGKAAKDFKAYAVTASFSAGELLRHSKFGDGVVVGVEPGKIEVLFESGTRKLAAGVG